MLRRFDPWRYPPELNFAHVAWLHRFLDRLAMTGFPAPRPLRLLNDASMVVVDGAIWEVLSHVPGRALMWIPRCQWNRRAHCWRDSTRCRWRSRPLTSGLERCRWTIAIRTRRLDRRSLSQRS